MPRILHVIGALFVAPVVLSAQSSVTIDAGSARLRFADSIDAQAFSISPAFSLSRVRASLRGFGTFSQLAGASTNSGSLDGSLFSARSGAFLGEVQGTAGGSSHSDGTRTGRVLAVGRMHVTSTAQGIWVGGGGGTTWDGAWRKVLQGDAGGWLTRNDKTFSLGVNPTVVDDSIKYTDTYFAAHGTSERLDLDASIGFRVGAQLPSLPSDRSLWGGVSATYWMVPRLGLVAGIGTYPVDFTQGFPGGKYLSIGSRWRWSSRAPDPVRPVKRETRSAVQRWDVVSTGSSRRLRIFAPQARAVEVTGDFTRWSPMMLSPEGNGWWSRPLAIGPGNYEMNVRVNGGAWLVPPGMLSLAQEFGGQVGVLVIR